MFIRHKIMFRHELLMWLTPKEMVKVARLSASLYNIINSNKRIFQAMNILSENYDPEYRFKSQELFAISSHFIQILKQQKKLKKAGIAESIEDIS